MDPELNRRTTPATHIGTAEMSLAMWLRNGRAQRNLSLEAVAKITKIQARILERLEAGRLDGLPADVFVRGFVRSFARCVGLDEAEALRRYVACAKDGAKAPAGVAVRAVIDAMGDLAPNARAKAPRILRDEPEAFPAGSMEIPASPPVVEVEVEVEVDVPVEITFAEASEVISVPIEKIEPASLIEDAPAVAADAVVAAPPADMDLSAEIVVAAPNPNSKKKRTRKAAAAPADVAPKRRRSKVATGTPSEPTPVVAQSEELAEPVVAAEPAAKSRRRKPRGSVQPPIIEPVEIEAEAHADVEITTDDPSSEPASDLMSIETTSSDGAIAIESITAASSFIIDATPASSFFDAPIVDSSHGSEAGGEIAARPIAARPIAARPIAARPIAARPIAARPIDAKAGSDFAIESSSIEVVDASTTRFEREWIDDENGEAPVQLATAAWTPRMPPFPLASHSTSAGWRRSPVAASLVAVIDDADPDGAERALEDRRAQSRRTFFLPPILLDREGDRSARQGGLTLAVIILLIAATLTLSYLMRRPSAAGDGVTQLDSTTETLRLS